MNTKTQARIIRNAARYLTGEAREDSIVTTSSDNRRSYDNSVTSTIQVQQMVVRDEQDMTEYSFDCLTRKYTKMTLGTVADGLEANTISPRQIPAGSITGSKIAINSVGIGQLQDGSVGSLQIQDAAMGLQRRVPFFVL